MLRRTLLSRYQVGVHVPPSEGFRGARMKSWPRQKVPANLEFLPEQRWAMQPLPRDTGKVPRNFVLKMLYFEQPVAVESLWEKCAQDSECVLESRRHLREVLRQCRDENFIYFEKDVAPTFDEETKQITSTNPTSSSTTTHSNTNNNSQSTYWMCYLTRERFDEVRNMVTMLPDAAGSAMSAGMRGDAADETAASAELFRDLEAQGNGMSDREKIRHLEMLRSQTEAASKLLSDYQRVELDFVPYTDLNGKVKQMWFYETSDISTKPKEEEDGDEAEAEEEEQPEVTIESSSKQ